MTTADIADRSIGISTWGASVRVASARAYCGPAHGHRWVWMADGPPPPAVDIDVGGQVLRYRLVHVPRTRRPARDYVGNLLHMPLRHALLDLPSVATGPAPVVRGDESRVEGASRAS